LKIENTMDWKKEMHKNSWFFILLAVVVGFMFPQLGNVMHRYIVHMLVVIMTLSFFKIHLKDLIKEKSHLARYIIVLIVIHVLIPFILYFFRFYLDPDVYLGFLLVSATSSGVSIIFLSDLFGGEPVKATIITTLSHLANPILIPGMVFLFGAQVVQTDFVTMTKSIFLLVILPMILAEGFKKIRIDKGLSSYSSDINLAVLLLIIYAIIASNRDYITINLRSSLLIAFIAVALSLLTFILGYLIGKSRKDKITFGLACSFKNFTLAIVLATTLFSPAVALVPIAYSIVSNILLAPVQLIFRSTES
jgi:BASS family bile acid:Na+ symporter